MRTKKLKPHSRAYDLIKEMYISMSAMAKVLDAQDEKAGTFDPANPGYLACYGALVRAEVFMEIEDAERTRRL